MSQVVLRPNPALRGAPRVRGFAAAPGSPLACVRQASSPTLDIPAQCIYIVSIRFTWDDTKRTANLAVHGFDFSDAQEVFSGPTFTFEDSRFTYTEERFVTLGMLRGFGVSIVHTETPRTIRIISFRKATKNEQTIFFKQIQN